MDNGSTDGWQSRLIISRYHRPLLCSSPVSPLCHSASPGNVLNTNQNLVPCHIQQYFPKMLHLIGSVLFFLVLVLSMFQTLPRSIPLGEPCGASTLMHRHIQSYGINVAIYLTEYHRGFLIYYRAQRGTTRCCRRRSKRRRSKAIRAPLSTWRPTIQTTEGLDWMK